MAAAEGSSQLMDELRESYFAGGGTDEDWRDLVSRPNLPCSGLALTWVTSLIGWQRWQGTTWNLVLWLEVEVQGCWRAAGSRNGHPPVEGGEEPEGRIAGKGALRGQRGGVLYWLGNLALWFAPSSHPLRAMDTFMWESFGCYRFLGALRLSYGKNEVVSGLLGPLAGHHEWGYDQGTWCRGRRRPNVWEGVLEIRIFLVEKSRRHVGKLFRSGLEQMTWIRSSSCTHQHPSRCELVTLSMALDLLMEQKFAELGDLLMQRMKAVEKSLTEGWSVANHQELIPGPKASLTTDQERSFAARQAVQKKKLQEVVGHKKKTGYGKVAWLEVRNQHPHVSQRYAGRALRQSPQQYGASNSSQGSSCKAKDTEPSTGQGRTETQTDSQESATNWNIFSTSASPDLSKSENQEEKEPSRTRTPLRSFIKVWRGREPQRRRRAQGEEERRDGGQQGQSEVARQRKTKRKRKERIPRKKRKRRRKRKEEEQGPAWEGEGSMEEKPEGWRRLHHW